MKMKLNAVAATILAGLLSTSVFAAPPAPSLNKPANNPSPALPNGKVLYTWTVDQAVTSQRIVVSQNQGFTGFRDTNGTSSCDTSCFTRSTSDGSDRIIVANKTAASFTQTVTSPGQTYWWKVRVNSPSGATWSGIRSFTIAGSSNTYGQSIWNEANRAYNNGEVKYYKSNDLVIGKQTYCAVFVRLVFGEYSGKGDANAVCQSYENKGVMKKSGTPSTGAAVCYKPASSNGYSGHIAIADGNGKELGVETASKGVSLRKSPSYWGWISADNYKSYY